MQDLITIRAVHRSSMRRWKGTICTNIGTSILGYSCVLQIYRQYNDGTRDDNIGSGVAQSFYQE